MRGLDAKVTGEAGTWPSPRATGALRVLVLGGTTEASAVAARLAGRAGFDPILSLAGRTAEPRPAPIPTRIGGFGGPEGLAKFLTEAGIAAVLDATHPFAALMCRNAAEACARVRVPLLALRRRPWERQPGDRWIEVASMGEAVEALGEAPRRVFLTIGRLELGPFAAAPQHAYLVRTIDPIGDALTLPHLSAIRDRGPFDEAAERRLLAREGVEVVVTKNSGGAATYPKIAAARALRLPVVMVARPEKPDVPAVDTADEVVAWLERCRAGGDEGHGRAP